MRTNKFSKDHRDFVAILLLYKLGWREIGYFFGVEEWTMPRRYKRYPLQYEDTAVQIKDISNGVMWAYLKTLESIKVKKGPNNTVQRNRDLKKVEQFKQAAAEAKLFMKHLEGEL